MTLKRLLLALILTGVLLTIPLSVYAQEEAVVAEDVATIPEGLTTLIFLLGAGAIVLVGGTALARDSFKSENGE